MKESNERLRMNDEYDESESSQYMKAYMFIKGFAVGKELNRILSESLYQTEMGKKVRTEIEKDTVEDFFKKYQFLTLSTCRSWVGRDARLLAISLILYFYTISVFLYKYCIDKIINVM